MQSEAKKKADRPSRKSPTGTSSTVRIRSDVDRQLTKSAKALGLSKNDFATAAVAYFTERELNPVSDRTREGLLIQRKLNDRCDHLEQQLKSLGDRIFGFLQTSEKSVLRFMVAQEQMLFAPMIEHLLRGAVDAYMARQLGEQILLKQHERLGEYDAKHAKQNQKRDKEIAERMLSFQPTRVPNLPKTVAPTSTSSQAESTPPASPRDTY